MGGGQRRRLRSTRQLRLGFAFDPATSEQAIEQGGRNIEQCRTGGGYRRAAPISELNHWRLPPETTSLICFSHLRWHFVYQRPQHLMARFAREYRVFFIEEPVTTDAAEPWLESHAVDGGIQIVVPRIPSSLTRPEADAAQRVLVDRLLAAEGIRQPVLYHFTPLALKISDQIGASLVVSDCMDELSAFSGASPERKQPAR